MLKNLVGAQILKIEDDKIKVKLGEETYVLEIQSDDGDCCGYADFSTNLFYSEDDKRNPIITDVSIDHQDGYDYSSSTVTFYGESDALASIDSNASSGSGYGYGAFVTLVCAELDVREELAHW